MAMSATLSAVKKAVGITGDYNDDTVQEWFNETVAFLEDAGVSESYITTGVVARGVLDLWNLGAGDGELSPYFKQRAIQLAMKSI